MIKRSLTWLVLVAGLVLVSAPPAVAQGSSSISGTVVDSGGGAIPGAAVVIKGESGTTFESVTNTEGVFSIPAIPAGNYTVSVTLTGFKTVNTNVRLQPNTPASLKMVLEVGQISETITVASSSELVNTQTATVAATLNSDQLNRMPTPTRNALNAVTFLPGINTPGTNRDSTINGLPESFIQITLDGVNNNDNFLRTTDSFFASVTPRQDAVEAVSVVLGAGGANVGGSGMVSINFQTRSGTNRFSGTAYEYFRHPSLNTNNWINKRNGEPKNDVKLNQYGARLAGPITIPGLYDGRGKAFYMFHYEQLRFPNSFTRERTILNPRALDGWFMYNVGTTTREVNLLQLAASRGQVSQTNPLVMDLLKKIQQATTTAGTVSQNSDPLLQTFAWQSPGELFEHQPTLKIDYNLTDKHRLSGSTQVIFAKRDPDYLNSADARFPGAPVYRLFTSTRPLHTLSLRSTLSQNVVNELRGGITAAGGSSSFGDDSTNGAQNFADQAGYAIDFDANIGLTNWHAENNRSWRSSPTFSLDESVTWQRGTHSLNFGASAVHVRAWENAQQYVPGINLGFSTNNDPAATMFTSTLIPGASAAQLTDARELYALLTGRVASITGQAALDPATNRYLPFSPRRREGYINMFSGFAQDSWRVTPTLTFNYGLRYDLQLPFVALNDTMSSATMASVCGISGPGDGGTYSKCNFNALGAQASGVTPEFVQYSRGTKGYDTDTNNFSPNVSFAWRPNVQSGFLRSLLGDPEQATLRAGWSVAYERQGMNQFTGVFGANPGSTLALTRSEAIGNLVYPGEQWPVLLSQTNRLGTAAFPETPTYPIAVRAGRADSISAFAPDIKIASAQSWTVSFQRSITKDMAVDIRYLGTKGMDQWSTLNWNTRDIEKNGFLDEFWRASQNLKANLAAGRGATFAYTGAPGTSPLPIYLAYINGSTAATNPAAYTGSNWTNSAITQDMVPSWPDPFSSVADLDNNSTFRANAIKAGLPANFFVLNPDVAAVNVTDSGAFSDYHALQIDLRRRLSKGLSASANYQYAIERGSAFNGFRYGRSTVQTNPHIRHAIKTQWDWTIPVGRGQRFGANMPALLDGILGGWSLNGVGRIQAAMVNFGNVRLVGMTKEDVQSLYKHDIRINPANGLQTVYMMPDDIILNTRRAFSTDPQSVTGYGALGAPEGRYFAPANYGTCVELRGGGDCAPRQLMIRGPWFSRFDMGVTKKFPIKGRTNIEVRMDVLNVFDNINFDNVANPGSGTGIFQTTGFYDDPSNTYDPGGRLGQLMFRFNW